MVRQLHLCVILLAMLGVGFASYPQVFSDRYMYNKKMATWPVLGLSSPVRQIAIGTVGGQEVAWMLSDTALYQWTGTGVAQVQTDVSITAGMRVLLYQGTAVIAGPTAVTWLTCSTATKCATTGTTAATLGRVTSIVLDDVNLVVGIGGTRFYTTSLQRPGDALDGYPQIDHPVTALAWSKTGRGLSVGTDWKLWRLNYTSNIWRFEWAWGVIDNNVTALTYADDGTLWIGNSDALNTQQTSGEFARLSGIFGGLPRGNITALSWSAAGNSRGLWVGGQDNAVSFYQPWMALSTFGPWRYFSGARWLPPGNVLDVKVWPSQDRTIVATDQGIAIIRWQVWKLEDKAKLMESIRSARHNRNGFVTDVGLNVFGDPSSYTTYPTDNDGLWTSMYVMSQCFRYAATKDPQAKANAWQSTAAMEVLNDVTGIKGLFARAVWPTQQDPQPQWHNSTTIPGLWWKSDASSDEAVGHMAAFAMMYQLVAETDAEKTRMKNRHLAIVDYIVANNFTLVDITGKRTKWGFWDPINLNEVSENYDERGINSLQIQQFLGSAYYLSKDQHYLDLMNQLGIKSQYFANLLNQKITTPNDNNYSDDELSYVPYLVLFSQVLPSLPHPFGDVFRQSILRTYKFIRSGHMSPWIFTSAMALGTSTVNLIEPIEHLQRQPTEQIQWGFHNSNRLDVRIMTEGTREGELAGVKALPPDENSMMRWNGNPFQLDGDGGGYGETDGAGFLFAYWLARWQKFVNE